jgi:hypothetical protein
MLKSKLPPLLTVVIEGTALTLTFAVDVVVVAVIGASVGTVPKFGVDAVALLLHPANKTLIATIQRQNVLTDFQFLVTFFNLQSPFIFHFIFHSPIWNQDLLF